MRVGLLHARTGWHTDQLCRALQERGHSAHVVRYEGLLAHVAGAAPDALTSDGVALTECDAVLARIIPSGSLEQLIFRVDTLHWLEDRGIRVVNSARAIERTVDKFYTTVLLRERGVPTPETIVCETAADALAAVREMGAVVVKPLFGSMGQGLARVGTADDAFRVFKLTDLARGVYYLQRSIDHGGRDYRIFVVGRQVIGGIERTAPAGEWRCNMSRGATARPLHVDARLRDLALTAAEAVGADYAGVDVLPAADGTHWVIEVNGIPGWEGFQQATGIDVAASVVRHLETRVGGR